MRKGFTLIELLVVIAIIAILAAILFPVFTKARQNAFQSQCLAHGRELGQAMLMYLDDNNDRFPSNAKPEEYQKFAGETWEYDWPYAPGIEKWSVGPLNQFAYIQLAKYTKNKQMWICPSPSGPYGTKYAYGYRNSWFFIWRKIGYGQDRATYPDTPFWYEKDDGTGQPDGVGRLIPDVLGTDKAKYGRPGAPSKKIFAFCYALGPDIPVEAYPGGPVITPYYPHNDGSIYVYLDGHAKWGETGCGWAPVGYTNHRMDRPHRR
ncbi:MAG: prepilin-type N-terminal cleavage/methylation domain-containing protein [Armatimonadota bacterium]|nr:prepilin-type N-terminal cleavage/methylation domain-containing protein [Armatimonadota bacterium]